MRASQQEHHKRDEQCMDRSIIVTEEASDFTDPRSTIVYAGCCCCCCCLWTPGGIIGGIIGYQVSKKKGELKYKDLPKCIRRTFAISAWLTAYLSLLGILIYFQIQFLSSNDFWFALVALLPLGIIPITIGGLLGAYIHRALHTDIAISQMSLRPIWRVLAYAWLGTIAGILLGIGAIYILISNN